MCILRFHARRAYMQHHQTLLQELQGDSEGTGRYVPVAEGKARVIPGPGSNTGPSRRWSLPGGRPRPPLDDRRDSVRDGPAPAPPSRTDGGGQGGPARTVPATRRA